MDSDRLERQRKTTMLHYAMEAEESLNRIKELPGRCRSLDYFSDHLLNFSRGELPPTNRKRVGTTCVQVPNELIHALGADPIRLCDGAYAFDQVGAEFMPAKSCPLTRATTGKLWINMEFWKDALDGIIVPTTCDQKRKLSEHLDSLGYKVHALEFPATKESELAVSYWQESVKHFALYLEKLTGTKLTKKRLAEAIKKDAESSRLFRLLQKFQKQENPLLYGVDMFLVMSCYFIDNQDNWQQGVRELIKECESRPASDHVGRPRAPRIIFTGSPAIFPNLKIPLLVEEAGGLIVGDETCSSSRILYDAVAYDEENFYDMLPAIADRYLKPCTCPCFTPNHDRGRKIQELIEGANAESVVYQSLSGCLPYELEQKPIGDLLTADKVPQLFLETDYSPEDVGQLSTRIEAFLESIQSRRRRSIS